MSKESISDELRKRAIDAMIQSVDDADGDGNCLGFIAKLFGFE